MLLALLLLAGCAQRPRVVGLERVRDCILGGEPETVEEWREIVLDCTE